MVNREQQILEALGVALLLLSFVVSMLAYASATRAETAACEARYSLATCTRMLSR